MLFTVDIPNFGGGEAWAFVLLHAGRNCPTWQIQRVEEQQKDRRRKSICHCVDTSSAAYRRLAHDERPKFEQDFFRNLLGEEGYKQALREAWMQAMPEELREVTT